MIVAAVINILLADQTVVAAVGDRIYPRQLPDAPTFPALVVTKASGIGLYTNDGDTGLEDARVQVDCYGDQGLSAIMGLRNAVRRRLSAYTTNTRESAGTCVISSCFCINEIDLSEPATERAGPRLTRRMLEFHIWHREI